MLDTTPLQLSNLLKYINFLANLLNISWICFIPKHCFIMHTICLIVQSFISLFSAISCLYERLCSNLFYEDMMPILQYNYPKIISLDMKCSFFIVTIGS